MSWGALLGAANPSVSAGAGAMQSLSGGTSSAESGGDVSGGSHTFNFAPPQYAQTAQTQAQMLPWLAVAVVVVVFLLMRGRK